ncbi:flagellar motor protein MotB [Ferrimonas lipolytica]|uniref:Flagellar motor protein MotB n=1 Tax=Ferrimonas lipolytica TaxID=2724191 RepID=A0A6H1U961_9GAMM|nr:flagellar motor protein MotB [Ferrimonas lipolytica]QIZ75585.1 flagellar motor protein MotB [Ferrimonas lipolytica]
MEDMPQKKQAAGSPAWMATFADLMSLLMCFFVLLLAFSEMDVLKFKQVAGSMKYAFGVQNKIEVTDIPRGTSVIAMEFRPGRPDPTPIEVLNQQTVEFTEDSLNYQPGESSRVGGMDAGEQREQGASKSASEDTAAIKTTSTSADNLAGKHQDELAKKVADELQQQIIDGAIEVESLGQQIIIRIQEQGAFPAASAFLQPKFRPVIRKIGELLNDVPGIITISGHTDTGKISNELYGSNWELSSQRAVAVAHEITEVDGFEEQRMKVQGLAEYHPIADNDTWAGRKRNRRVEIAIEQGKAKESEPISVLP